MSSQLEGTHAGIGDLLEYEATHDASSVPADTRSTLDYVLALQHGLKAIEIQGGKALNEELIKGLHRCLMSSNPLYQDKPGEFRTIQNWIGGMRIQEARFVPPRPERVPECMADLVTNVMQYEPEGNAFAHIVLRAGVAHAQFETIHPFRDGNGRTGRLLIPIMLASEGYPPLYLAGPLYRNQREYFDALLQVQLRSDWSGWIRFFAQAMALACEESIDIATRLIHLREAWRETIKNRRADSAVRKLVELLIGTPVVTAGGVKEMLSCSFPAANNSIADLVSFGILKDSGRKRNRFFVATDVIDILNQRDSDPRVPSQGIRF